MISSIMDRDGQRVTLDVRILRRDTYYQVSPSPAAQEGCWARMDPAALAEIHGQPMTRGGVRLPGPVYALLFARGNRTPVVDGRAEGTVRLYHVLDIVGQGYAQRLSAQVPLARTRARVSATFHIRNKFIRTWTFTGTDLANAVHQTGAQPPDEGALSDVTWKVALQRFGQPVNVPRPPLRLVIPVQTAIPKSASCPARR